MSEDPQFIATPSPLDQGAETPRIDNPEIAHAAAAAGDAYETGAAAANAMGVDSSQFETGAERVEREVINQYDSATDESEHKTLRDERLEYWNGKTASTEYLMSKKFDRDIAEEAKANLDANGKITEVTPELLVNLEEKMYVYIEQARRNLEESRRFDDTETFSSTDVFQRLQDLVSSDPESEVSKRATELLKNKTATIGELHNLLVESETNAAYECLEKAHEIAGFLNDVGSGHASRSLLEEQATTPNVIALPSQTPPLPEGLPVAA